MFAFKTRTESTLLDVILSKFILALHQVEVGASRLILHLVLPVEPDYSEIHMVLVQLAEKLVCIFYIR